MDLFITPVIQFWRSPIAPLLSGSSCTRIRKFIPMPARVDPVERRKHVVDAAFRCVVAEGFEGASLRKVAAEADLNIGSVRHFFHGHGDLLVAAATEAGDRMDARLGAIPIDGLCHANSVDTVKVLRALLEQVLPMDAERTEEAIVVVEFVLASRLHPTLAVLSKKMHDSLHSVVADAYKAASIPDAERAARQTTAMIGGLTTDAITPHGEISASDIAHTLHSHLTLLVNQRESS